MSVHITTGTVTVANAADGIRITVNLGYTGSLTVATLGSTQYGTAATTLGIVTNPVTGQEYTYRNLRTQGAITVAPSTTTDLSVDLLGPGVSS